MNSQKFGRRIERFLIFRLAAIPVAFLLVALCQAGLAPPFREPAFHLLYGLLGFYTLLAVGAMAIASRVRHRYRFAFWQVLIDFVFEGAIIWTTGGVESVFCPLLFATLFIASTVLRGPGVLIYASLSTAFLAANTLASELGLGAFVFPRPGWDLHGDGAGTAAHLLAMGLALHAVALLGIRLSGGLRRIQSIQEEIIETMGEGLVAVDGDMRILEMNGEARRIFSIPEDRACSGRTLEEVFPGGGLGPVREAFRLGERRRFEFTVERPEGGDRPVEAKITSAEDGGGGLRFRIGLFGDLSFKQEIEAAEKRIHKLEELYDMALGIAHEIRNPLASIQGCAQEIGRSTNPGQRERRLVDIICRESGRLDRIIEEFMTHARRGPGELQPLDLRQVVDETAIQLRNHAEVAGRRITVDLPAEPFTIAGDFPSLKQVFLNLGINAIEATDSATGTIHFSFHEREFQAMNRRRAGERRLVAGVEVEVVDNGSGIPRDSQKLLFTPFFTTKEKGHGLGLSLVHRLINDHFGAVSVESQEGEGTRFRVWFPLVEAKKAAAAPPATGGEFVHA